MKIRVRFGASKHNFPCIDSYKIPALDYRNLYKWCIKKSRTFEDHLLWFCHSQLFQMWFGSELGINWVHGPPRPSLQYDGDIRYIIIVCNMSTGQRSECRRHGMADEAEFLTRLLTSARPLPLGCAEDWPRKRQRIRGIDCGGIRVAQRVKWAQMEIALRERKWRLL